MSEDQPSTSTNISQIFNDNLDVKSNYVKLLDEASSIGQRNGSGGVQDPFISIIAKADSLLKQANNPTVLYLDAQVLNTTTHSLEQVTDNVNVGEGSFNVLQFAEQLRLKSSMNGKSSMAVFTAQVKPVVYNSIPYWHPFIGGFEYSCEDVKKKLKQRKVCQKDVIATKKEPEKVTQVSKTQDTVEELVQDIYKKLRQHYKSNNRKPLNYFRFVVNPHSFSKTVENIFHTSFLVHDGHVVTEFVEIEPLIYPVSKENLGNNSQQSRKNKQFFVNINMKIWQDLIDVLEIKEAMI